jgi:hypothetical protein
LLSTLILSLASVRYACKLSSFSMASSSV